MLILGASSTPSLSSKVELWDLKATFKWSFLAKLKTMAIKMTQLKRIKFHIARWKCSPSRLSTVSNGVGIYSAKFLPSTPRPWKRLLKQRIPQLRKGKKRQRLQRWLNISPAISTTVWRKQSESSTNTSETTFANFSTHTHSTWRPRTAIYFGRSPRDHQVILELFRIN